MPSRRGHGPGFRPTEWIVLALALLAALWGVIVSIAQAESLSVRAATYPAGIIIVLTALHMWARRRSEMSSTRYLVLFSFVISAVVAMSGFVFQQPPLYAWGELVLGCLLMVATAYEAWISYPSREGRRPLDPRTNV